jgi:disulfide oxidoreductase YuzD
VEALEDRKDPRYISNVVEQNNQVVAEVLEVVAGIKRKLKEYALESKYLEIFEPEEIKKLYVESGLTQAEVGDFIKNEIYGGQEVSPAMISKHCSGEIKDLLWRSIIGKYFRREIISRKT